MLETLDTLIARVGPEAYLVLFLAAAIEYVFPPFPGDTVALFGGVYAARGQKPWALVLAAVTLGSVLGSALDYWVGKRLQHRYHPRRLAGVLERMRRWGDWLIVLNRFFPGIRGLFFAAAGASGMPFGRTMALGAVSAVVWNALLIAAGVGLGGNAERLEGWVRRYQSGAAILLGLFAAAWLARVFIRSRRRGANDGAP